MKSKGFLFLSLWLALVTLTNTACVKENSTLASASSKSVAENAISEDKEIAVAEKLIEQMPDSTKGYNRLAVVYIHRARETGDFSLNSKAEAAVNRALEIKKDDYEAQKIKASLLLTFHKFQEALEFGTQLQKQSPKDFFIYGVLTDANVELGNYTEAVDAVQQMVDLRPNMESYARVSYVRSLHGDADGAIDAMNMAARIADPMDKEARAWCLVHLGDEYFKTGRFDEAEKQYDTALKIFPNYHFAVAGKGHARAAVSDYENAVKFYLQAQEKVPLTDTVIALGDVYQKLGKTEDAQKQYELAAFIEQKLGNIDQRRLALLWADHDTKLDEALDIATREHAARKDIFTADILAWCLYKKGQFEQAKTAMDEAMRLKTKDARFFYHSGMIEKGLGNKKAAEDFLQKALQTNPAFDVLQAENARQALSELKQS